MLSIALIWIFLVAIVLSVPAVIRYLVSRYELQEAVENIFRVQDEVIKELQEVKNLRESLEKQYFRDLRAITFHTMN